LNYIYIHAYLLTYNYVYFCRLTVIPVVFQMFKRYAFSQLLSYHAYHAKQLGPLLFLLAIWRDVELFVQA